MEIVTLNRDASRTTSSLAQRSLCSFAIYWGGMARYRENFHPCTFLFWAHDEDKALMR